MDIHCCGDQCGVGKRTENLKSLHVRRAENSYGVCNDEKHRRAAAGGGRGMTA